MAEQDDLISSYVDRPSLQNDTDFLLSQLKEVDKAFNNLNAKKVTVNATGGTSKEALAAIKAAKVANDELIRSKDKLLTIDLKEARAAKEIAQGKAAQARAARENAKAAESEAKTATLLNKEKERLLKTQEAERKKSEQLNSQYKVLSNRYNEAVQVSQHLGAALIRQANGDQAVEKQLLSTNAQYLEATEKAKEYDRQLKLLDATVGKHQRNVGNYASGFSGLGNSINQITRELPAFANSMQTGFLAISNNIPIFFDQMKLANEEIKRLRAEGKETQGLLATLGKQFLSFGTILSIGVTLLTIYGAQIAEFVVSMFKGTEAMDAFAEKQKAINEAFKESAVKDAVLAVEKVGAAFALAKAGTISNSEALKVYNEELGDTFGKANSLREAEEKYQANSENFIKATLFRAAAMKALEKASDAALKAQEAQLKPRQEFKRAADFIALGQGASPSGIDVVPTEQDIKEFNERVKKAEDERRKQEVDDARKNQQTMEDIAQGLFKTADEFASKLPKFKLFDDGKNKGDAQNVERDLKAVFEKFKRNNELLIAEQKRVADNEGLLLSQRVEARERINDLQNEMILAQQDFELKQLKAKTEEQLKEENLTAEAIQNIHANTADEIANINDQAATDLKEAERIKISDLIEMYAGYKEKQAELLQKDIALSKDLPNEGTILEKILAREEKAFERRKNIILENRDVHIAALERERNAKNAAAKTDEQRQKIEETYNRKRVLIELEADRAIIEATLEVTKAKLRQIDDPVKRAELEAKIAELNRQLEEFKGKAANIQFDISTTAFQSKMQELEGLFKKIQEGAKLVFDTVGGFINANVERQKNALREEMDLIEERKAKEIAAIQQTQLSEQDKAAQIAQVNAKAQSQKEAIERRNRQLETERARFEKIANIGRISIETALAVIHQLATGDALTAFARAAVAGAIGAAQLAVAIATPLPRYAEGTKEGKPHPGGKAIMGDAFKSEYYVLPDGSIYKSADKPTIYDIPRGTEVYKDEQAFLEGAFKSASRSIAVASIPQGNGQEVAAVIRQEIGSLKQVIRNKKEVHFRGSHTAAMMLYKNAESWVKYIKDQTDW